MDNLYFENENSYTTTIKAKEISNNITEILTKRIRDEIEGKCIKEGYIKKDSVRIVSRSTGQIMNMQFNGSVIYHIKYVSKICLFVFLALGINYLGYSLYLKATYMLEHITTPQQNKAWLAVYKEMKFRCIFGMILGIIGYLILGQGLCT